MTEIEFTDGERFRLEGRLRLTKRKDGWYVIGDGLLIPVESRDESERILEELEGGAK